MPIRLSRLNRHVAERHARFHRQGGDCRSRIFDCVAYAAAGPYAGDQRQNDVLDSDAGAQLAGQIHAHALVFSLPQGLGRQSAFHFARANAKGDGAA